MNDLKVGDVVSRKSYGSDILFKVIDIKNSIVTLKGICYRIEADSPLSDLVIQTETRIQDYHSPIDKLIARKNLEVNTRRDYLLKKSYARRTPKENISKFYKPVKILHLDGDNEYLEKCLDQYKKFDLNVVGKFVPEKSQPSNVYSLLKEYTPDILVLTGHDGVIKAGSEYLNINSYRNSRHFIESVKEARRFDSNLDSLIIFAGACQSMYYEIIKAGANYASSPYRVLIHALDPVFICNKIAYSSIESIVEPLDAINSTITGVKGIGGIESRGKLREIYPKEPYT